MVENIVHIADIILFFCMGISVVYLFIYAFASMLKRTPTYGAAKKQHRYAVLFPAYKEDKVIVSSVTAFLNQEYPRTHFEVVVISDQMKDETNQELSSLDITLLKANYTDSSKAKALQLAIHSLDESRFDAIIIMDGDNLVEPDYLRKVNDAYDAGHKAIQTHRMAKNRNSSTAMLDAASEEMNNSIFRKGHVRLGISSALIGSGMIFEYAWFKKNIFEASTAGEDKELEALLLKQRIYIEYLEEANVYDEKIPKDAAFYNQRRRWLAANYGILAHTFADLPKAITSCNWSYVDKILQWIMLPRVILLGAIGFFALLTTLYDWTLSVKWWGLLCFLMITLLIAIPKYLMTKELARAMVKVPWLGLLMFINLFRLRGVNKKFIHTDHEG